MTVYFVCKYDCALKHPETITHYSRCDCEGVSGYDKFLIWYTD